MRRLRTRLLGHVVHAFLGRVVKTARGAMAWTDSETFMLIELWGNDAIQDQLEGCTRNRVVYEKLARGMETAGYKRTAIQCREKIKKLKADYRKIKDHHDLTGRGRKTWVFLDKMEEILGSRPTTTPPVLIDTSAKQIVVVNAEEDRVMLENDELNDSELEKELNYADPEELKNKEKSDVEVLKDVKELKDVHKLKDVEVLKDTEELKDVEKKDIVKTGEKIGKRKRESKGDTIQNCMDKVMCKMAKAQRESDMLYMEIENRRLQFEERMLEMEERRQKENRDREERQRKEDREFQLQVYFISADKTRHDWCARIDIIVIVFNPIGSTNNVW